MTTMDDLTAFIAVRLDEDEAAAKAATDGPWVMDGMSVRGADRARHGGKQAAILVIKHTWPQEAAHIVRHDPARVLREIAAKRAIMTRHERQQHHAVPAIVECGWCANDRSSQAWPCPDISAIAAIWSDHHDYRPEWAASEPS